MSRRDHTHGKGVTDRRAFLRKVATAGAGVTILGSFPAVSQKILAADAATGPLALQGAVQLGRTVPVIARSDMIQIDELDFMVRKGYVRVDVAYRFVDGRTDGGALFKMKLLSADGKVLAEQTTVEERIRARALETIGGITELPDAPNRCGKAELRFRSTPPGRVSEFLLEVSTVN